MGDEFFAFEVVSGEDAQVVSLRGELDVANSGQVKRELLAADSPTVVVDLSALTFIDSSGLTALVHAHNHITRNGRAFELRGARDAVKRVFEISGLTGLLAEG